MVLILLVYDSVFSASLFFFWSQVSSLMIQHAGFKRTTGRVFIMRRGLCGRTQDPMQPCGLTRMTVHSLYTAHTRNWQSWEPSYQAKHRQTTPKSTCTAVSLTTLEMMAASLINPQRKLWPQISESFTIRFSLTSRCFSSSSA